MWFVIMPHFSNIFSAVTSRPRLSPCSSSHSHTTFVASTSALFEYDLSCLLSVLPSKLASRSTPRRARPCPVLYEPTYEVTVTAPVDDLGTLYDNLCGRGASEVSHLQVREDIRVTGILPVALASGLTDDLRGVTGGRAFPTVQFAGFRELEGNCVRGAGRAADVVRSVRERKGLTAEVPEASSLADKM
mmetsp:Transcript_72129/g.204841  ORF Transcript_72129/g.204841 Transcript_72129/m.204841 type:complete len:189 (-) Transcript_72129:195-761(-)